MGCEHFADARGRIAPSPTATYVFTGFVTDGLALRGIALVHAPDALPAIGRR